MSAVVTQEGICGGGDRPGSGAVRRGATDRSDWRALMRAVGPSYARCTVRGGRPPDIDWAQAAEQHLALADTLVGLGVAVRVLAPVEAFPDSVFIEDTAVIVGSVATICPFETPARVGEESGVERELQAQLAVGRLPRGALDGGDCIVTDRDVFVGLSGRSSGLAAQALAERHPERRVRAVPVEHGLLHLKCAASSLGGETLLIAEGALPGLVSEARSAGYRMLQTPPGEAYAANCLALGRDVIVAAGYPRTAELLDREGYRVHPVEISELAKGDGSVTCLSLVWRGRAAA